MTLSKFIHEIRDPIHVFIRFNSTEREVLNSRPFQRLRHIHQLAMSYLVYPGATHRRFEHSLGVMELASRVFDVITAPDALLPELRELIPEIGNQSDRYALYYWKQTLRMAALCHDMGHLPFSHAAEAELLPKGWDHERLTREIILSHWLQEIWKEMKLNPEDIVKLALGPKKAKDLTFTACETLLSEIIVGDAFGVDRMDYLLRDSHHTGVAYGRFDHYRLIDTMRILPPPVSGYKIGDALIEEDIEVAPKLGIEEGGLQSAESLLLARYFMFSQVYYHHVRVIYDIHLLDFLRAWLPGGNFNTDLDAILKQTDNEVTAAFREAAFDEKHPCHKPANCIVQRKHYKRFYRPTPGDIESNTLAGKAVKAAAELKFGEANIRYKNILPKHTLLDFPVKTSRDEIVSARALSRTINDTPQAEAEYVYIEPSLEAAAKRWLDKQLTVIIQPKKEESNGATS